jgi:hypothetical protein
MKKRLFALAKKYVQLLIKIEPIDSTLVKHEKAPIGGAAGLLF